MNNETYVLPFADFLLFVIGLDAKDQASSIDVGQFCRSSNLLSQWSGGQMTNIDMCANRNLSFIQRISDRSPGSIFHQSNHHRRAKYLNSTSSDGCCCVFMNNGSSSFSSHSKS